MAKSLLSSFLKQNLFSLKNNAILHNRVLLYFIFLLSLGNLFYLLMERDLTTIVIFLIVGFLTSFFSKNMLIILFVSVVVANILKYGARIRHEGLENIVEEEEEEDEMEQAIEGLEDAAAEEESDLTNEVFLEETESKKKDSKKSNKADSKTEENQEESKTKKTKAA